MLLESPETTGQAGQLPRRPQVLCDFGSAPKTGRQPMAATAVLLEQNLLREGAVPAPRRSSRIEGLPPQNFKEPDGRKHPGVGGADHVPPGPPAPRGQQTNAVRLVESLERLGDASTGITAAANSQVEKLMGGITKRSGSKSLSDPLMISRFEELRVCMLTYCGNNSRISIAATAGANRFGVIHNLWDDVTSLDLTVKPKLTQRLPET